MLTRLIWAFRELAPGYWRPHSQLSLGLKGGPCERGLEEELRLAAEK